MIDAQETLGQVARSHPAATHVFMRHRLDFCCGGNRKLAEACRAAGLDPQAVIAEIATEGAANRSPRWDEMPLVDLVDFIITRYHEPLRRDLPLLIAAAKKVERVHANKPSCPHGLAELLADVSFAVGRHLDKEEQVLFPAIRAGRCGAQLGMPIRAMHQDHDDHGANLRRIRDLAGGFAPPSGACATWTALYSGLEKLEAELMEHIHLENHVLFPRALGA